VVWNETKPWTTRNIVDHLGGEGKRVQSRTSEKTRTYLSGKRWRGGKNPLIKPGGGCCRRGVSSTELRKTINVIEREDVWSEAAYADKWERKKGGVRFRELRMARKQLPFRLVRGGEELHEHRKGEKES